MIENSCMVKSPPQGPGVGGEGRNWGRPATRRPDSCLSVRNQHLLGSGGPWGVPRSMRDSSPKRGLARADKVVQGLKVP